MQDQIDLGQLEAMLNETSQAAGKPQAHDTIRARVGVISPSISNASGSNSRSIAPRQTHAAEVVPPGKGVEAILAERSKTHGDFTDSARVMQRLKRILWAEEGWDRLSDAQREGLEMIVHKIGRIINGNANTKDHWDDIAGYAKLCSDRIVEG